MMCYVQFLYSHHLVLLEGQMSKQLQFRTKYDHVFDDWKLQAYENFWDNF